ncbi:hypothetical protein E0Z10_g9028 [Xylaria hypoxylon]|uniref:Methyltransferase domain-containing protein n=1 Tax=Xylaria hypoxylon TaxID=37992 RepID=A0A4Z0YQ58_9PEZI|nr:hypothetical protein E0Z10_g9028 [Xylaria hypoxylon]
MATIVEKMPTGAQAESIYILNSGAAHAEQERLNRQHVLFDDMMQNDLLPPHIASALSASPTPPKILEIATGTAVWLSEVAKTLPSNAEFVGLDFDTSKFPSSLPPNITLRQADMFKPFPSDLHEKFDVVNVRLIIFALKEGQGTDLLLTSIEPPSQAWFKFQDINWRFAKKVGRDLNLPIGMVHYIKEAGCVECDDKAYPSNSQLYTRERDSWISRSNVHVKALAEQSLRGITSLGGVEGMTTQEEVDELLASFDKEFGDRKIHYLFIRAWGRKPQVA